MQPHQQTLLERALAAREQAVKRLNLVEKEFVKRSREQIVLAFGQIGGLLPTHGHQATIVGSPDQFNELNGDEIFVGLEVRLASAEWLEEIEGYLKFVLQSDGHAEVQEVIGSRFTSRGRIRVEDLDVDSALDIGISFLERILQEF